MAWRISRSLMILRDEINALFPGRDKRTDGAISGYPGSISSHNVNSHGVVNAYDFTVGEYPGGIKHSDALILTEQIRLSIKNDPRGYDAYVIYENRIADGYTGEWRKYLGPWHGNHFHVSTAHDIPMNGITLGNNDYDIDLPWLTGGENDMATGKEIVDAFFEKKITVDGEEGRVLDWVVFLISKAKRKK